MRGTYYKRGQYQRGHGIKCKHCGRSYEEHEKQETARNSKARKKGFRVSLSACVRRGYEPKDMKRWERLERRYCEKEQHDFEMQCLERRAQGEAAWGRYGAFMRQQNQARDRAQLEANVARSGSGSERQAAEKRLGEFLRSTRHGGMLVIGSGAGRSDPD